MVVRVVFNKVEVFKTEVMSVSVPTVDGWQGIWPGQPALVMVLARGNVVAHMGKTIQEIAIENGVATIEDDVVTILSKRVRLVKSSNNYA